MNSRLGTFIGLLILLAGAVGIYVLFRQGPPVAEEPEQPAETVVPVEVARIRRMTMHDYARAYGSIVPDPGIGDTVPGSVRIDSPVDGLVSDVNCVIGQEVRKGQVLFSLYDRPARLALEQAAQAMRFAEENFQRQEKLKQVQGTSARLYLEAQQQLDSARNQLNRAQAELDLLKVTAPFDGTVMDVTARAGQAVMQTDALGRLTDLKRLLACVRVSSAEAGRLKPGQHVEFEVVASGVSADSPDPVPQGRVDYVDHRVDPNNDTVAVWVALPADANMRPGQFVRARIVVAEYSDRLAVPDESVVITPEGQTVVAIVQGDEAVPTPVKRGISEDGWVEVEGEGLAPEMTVVTVGAYGLPGKTKIRVMGP
jgi:RND family efflux transporter MFP subunit